MLRAAAALSWFLGLWCRLNAHSFTGKPIGATKTAVTITYRS